MPFFGGGGAPAQKEPRSSCSAKPKKTKIGFHPHAKPTCPRGGSLNCRIPVLCACGRVKEHHNLPNHSPILKNTCVRQVASLDKWFPLIWFRTHWLPDGVRTNMFVLFYTSGSPLPHRRVPSPPSKYHVYIYIYIYTYYLFICLDIYISIICILDTGGCTPSAARPGAGRPAARRPPP